MEIFGKKIFQMTEKSCLIKLNTLNIPVATFLLFFSLMGCYSQVDNEEQSITNLPVPIKATEMIEIEAIEDNFRPHEGFKFSSGSPIYFKSVDKCSNERSQLALRGDVYSCTPSALTADACWKSPIAGQIYCADFPWGGIINTYTLSQGIDLPELVSNPDSPPVPWGVELETGLRCRIRSGGGWNTRADSRLIPYYRCEGDNYFIVGESATSLFNKDSTIWTAQIATTGDLENSDSDLKKMRITKVWYAVDY